MKTVRLDRRLVELGLAIGREEASVLIASGRVRVDGVPTTRALGQVQAHRAVTLAPSTHTWVSRGALKLLGAFQDLDVVVTDRVCADLGASTGGFTEVLLHGGARRVYAVDVGHNLLHERIRTDERVVVLDGTNVRHLDALPEPIDVIVGDLSFIGWASVLPVVHRLLTPTGNAVLLVKPQFEVPRQSVAPGGRVRDSAARLAAIDRVAASARTAGFEVSAGVDARVAGARAGNVEHFLHLRPR